MRGQRFHVNLDAEAKDDRSDSADQLRSLDLGLIGDIKERPTLSAVKPPSPPSLRNTTNGFPRHKSRIGALKSQNMVDGQPLERNHPEKNQGPTSDSISAATGLEKAGQATCTSLK